MGPIVKAVIDATNENDPNTWGHFICPTKDNLFFALLNNDSYVSDCIDGDIMYEKTIMSICKRNNLNRNP